MPERSVGVQQVMLPWADEVSRRTDGTVVFDRYFGGSLGRDPYAQYELVRHGILDVGWILAGYTAGQFPQLEIVELPFLVESAEEASVAAWRLHADGLIDGTDAVHVVTIWTNDVAGVHSLGAVDSLDRLSTLRIRSSGAVQAAYLDIFDAAPQTMTAVEANDALRRGSLDGLIQGWTGIRTFRTDQITRQVLDVPSGAIAFLLLMNKARWQALTPTQQEAVMAAGGESLARRAGQAYDRIGLENERDAAQRFGYQVVRPTAADMDRYAERVRPLHAQWRSRTVNGDAVFRHYAASLEEERQR